jgi:hypothetical protein
LRLKPYHLLICSLFAVIVTTFSAHGRDSSQASETSPAVAERILPVPYSIESQNAPEQPEPGPVPPALVAPNDSCLPQLYTNWQEFAQESRESRGFDFKTIRILIDRKRFELLVEGTTNNDRVYEIYRTFIALVDVHSPTPDGSFLINHVYCYPDVVFFDATGQPIPGLYNGFFAPLLVCDSQGKCRRHRELGIHGFQAAAIPPGRHISPATFGAVSAGCIRVPDPCSLKKAVIMAAGVGPLKQNDRGSYHWLKKPVEVVIGDSSSVFEESDLASIIQGGLTQVQEGLKNLFDVFR